MKIDNSLLFKFFAKENSSSEADAIAKWLQSDEANVKEFEKAYKLFALSQVALSGMPERDSIFGIGRKRFGYGFAAALAVAAAIALGVFITGHIRQESVLRESVLVSEAKWGKQLTQTLSDGTRIEMNSGSRIEYPAIFAGKERRVKLDGEAIFDVTHDADKPFIVETFAYDVRVLGTRFDIVANEADGEFSTTLLEGSVEILDKDMKVRASLRRNQMVSLAADGTLHMETLDNPEDALLWTEDLISIAGVSFGEMMHRFEKGFGVTIRIDREPVTEKVLPYGKVRISDGVVSAFEVLRHHYDFTYEYDVQQNVYHIK